LILLIPLLTITFDRKGTAQKIITPIFVAAIVILTMFARIQAADHYLSDTAMAVFIGAVCYGVGYIAIYHLKFLTVI
jgi:fumarate reductase subunit D